MEEELGPIPPGERARELWIQHVAGHIVFRDIRGYARSRIAKGCTEGERIAAEKAIDDSVYGLMMVADGVSGRLAHADKAVRLGVRVELLDIETAIVEHSLDLNRGDGLCMGYHGWMEGDFGEDPVTR